MNNKLIFFCKGVGTLLICGECLFTLCFAHGYLSSTNTFLCDQVTRSPNKNDFYYRQNPETTFEVYIEVSRPETNAPNEGIWIFLVLPFYHLCSYFLIYRQ